VSRSYLSRYHSYVIFRKNVPAVYNIKTYGFSKKEMLAIVKFKESEGSFEKFMGFMQSEEGLSEKKILPTLKKQ